MAKRKTKAEIVAEKESIKVTEKITTPVIPTDTPEVSGKSADAPNLDLPPVDQSDEQKAYVEAFNINTELNGVMPSETLSTEELVKDNETSEILKVIDNGDLSLTEAQKVFDGSDVKGDFKFENGDPNGKVIFEPNPNGEITLSSEDTFEKKTIGLTYDEAMEEIKTGNGFVKLPEWGGYWTKEINSGKILVVTKEGEIFDTPFHDQYKDRNDWEVTDGKTPNIKTVIANNPTLNGIPIYKSIKNSIKSSSPTPPASFEDIHQDIIDGHKVTLIDEPGVYFILEAGRLKKHADNGDYIDSAPLYAYQDKTGWEVKK